MVQEPTQTSSNRLRVGDFVFIRARIEARAVDLHQLGYLNESLEEGERRAELADYYVVTVDRTGEVTSRSDLLAVKADHVVLASEARRIARGNT
jgi:hypothetical protein